MGGKLGKQQKLIYKNILSFLTDIDLTSRFASQLNQKFLII